jgi:phosphoribosylaminoimidazolecarboxamide formyltransferase/IMP cyclohydrolase
VVTLHPKIHGGILADLDNAEHRADLETHDIAPFALVVVNVYPFTSEPGIEMIDIGGPTMIRAAAKNHAHVGVVTSPEQYGDVISELDDNRSLSDATRRRLARAAFVHTAAYDAAIVSWFDTLDPPADGLPSTIHLGLERAQDLRYGENPHQAGGRYRAMGARSWWDTARQHGGKELSYLNVYDTEAAWRLVHALGDRPAAVVIKHANPCGAAVADDIETAYANAHACDPISAYGGIVAVNRPLTAALAADLAPVFTEVVVAPAYEAEALARLTAKKNLRVLEAEPPGPAGLQYRTIDGGMLVQTPDRVTWDPDSFRVVTGRARARRSGPTSRSRGGSVPRSRRTRSWWRRTARPGASGPGSRTGATPGGSPRRRRRVGPRAGPARRTPSSRSATGSTPPPRRAAAR